MKNKVTYYLIIIMLIMMPMIPLVRFYSVYLFHIPNFVSIHYGYVLWIMLPILLILTFLNIKDKSITINKYTIMILILILFYGISVNFAIDQYTAIYGFVARHEGILSILVYYLLLLNASTLEKEKTMKILQIVLIIGAIQAIHSIIQVIFRFPFMMKFHVPYMASGFCGNPNFFGTYMVICLTISIGYYILIKKSNLYFIYSILFLIGLIFAQSLAPFLGFILSYIFMMILLKYKKIRTYFIKFSVMLILVFIASNFLLKEVNQYYTEGVSVNMTLVGDLMLLTHSSPEKIQEVTGASSMEGVELGTGRFRIWKETLKIIEKNPWVGVGVDNFYYAYPQDIVPWAMDDKAHNEYLQIASTVGIPAGIVYLGLLAILFFQGIKSKENYILFLLFPFIGYSIQAFANISVIEIAPIYYIIMGFIIGRLQESH